MNCQRFSLSLLSLVICAVLLSCNGEKSPEKPDVLAAAMDTTVSPGEDFFHYAHGAWIKANPIPTTESSYGINIEVQNEVYSRLRGICESAAKDSVPANQGVQQIGHIWATGMDSLLIEKQRADFLRPYLNKINAVDNKQDLVGALGEVQMMLVRPLFFISVGQDDKNSEKYALFVYQGGLGL